MHGNFQKPGKLPSSSARQRVTGQCAKASPQAEICGVIRKAGPGRVIWVGDLPGQKTPEYRELAPLLTARAATLEEGYSLAKDNTLTGSIVLAVKTWR